MSGASQPRKRRGQGASAANEQPPSLQLPKGLQRQRCARVHQTSDQRHFHPSRWIEKGATLGAPRGSPLLTCPPEGREEEEEEAPGFATNGVSSVGYTITRMSEVRYTVNQWYKW